MDDNHNMSKMFVNVPSITIPNSNKGINLRRDDIVWSDYYGFGIIQQCLEDNTIFEVDFVGRNRTVRKYGYLYIVKEDAIYEDSNSMRAFKVLSSSYGRRLVTLSEIELVKDYVITFVPKVNNKAIINIDDREQENILDSKFDDALGFRGNMFKEVQTGASGEEYSVLLIFDDTYNKPYLLAELGNIKHLLLETLCDSLGLKAMDNAFVEVFIEPLHHDACLLF